MRIACHINSATYSLQAEMTFLWHRFHAFVIISPSKYPFAHQN